MWCTIIASNAWKQQHPYFAPEHMATTAHTLYPEIDPFNQGWLEVSGGHRIYFEECGNPQGAPVVFLHGGPGSGCNPGQRRFFDPTHYRVILFDQRGCGRSLPLGLTEANATQLLVEDIDQLRTHLGVDRWLVFGGSWGSTLALAYASRHAASITGMILRGIFLSRHSELEWFLHSVKQFFPEAWENLVSPLSEKERQDVMGAYKTRIDSGNVAAARQWNAYESAIMSLLPSATPPRPVEDAVTLARARVQLHYLMHQCFLKETPLLSQVDRFRHLPAIIIQGRYDMVCPPVTAHELHQVWPEAEYVVVPDAGHSAMEPGIIDALVSATEQFKPMR